MRLALREVRRRPLRFVVATILLTFLTVLLLLLGGLLDGLFLGSTGALRAQDADVVVYSSNSRDQLLRSRITPDLRTTVEQTPGVARTGGLGVALVGAKVPDQEELAETAVLGYELAPTGVPAPPPPGSAWADERLKPAGVREGQTLLVGPAEVPIEVLGFVKDTSYQLQGSLWVEPGTWREVQNTSRPDARVTDGVFQALVVQGTASPATIDAGTEGATSSLTKAQAVESLPGTKEQRSTFNGIIVATFLVAGLVVALFFALLVRERTPLYGVLKALGASTRQLFSGVLAQAVLVTLTAFFVGAAVAFAAKVLIPPEVPLLFQRSRAVTTAVVLVVVAVLASALSLRRVASIDPASAIGSSS